MKKGIRQKRGLAVFIAATMVVGLMPGLDIEKASAAKSGESTTPQVEGYSDDGFCDNYEWKNGSLVLKEGITACETHTDCNGYQPAVEEVLDFDINGDKKINGNDKAYKITNAGQLYWFAGLVNGTLKGVDQNRYANAILTQSITVNKDVLGADSTLNSLTDLRYWTPIGNGKNSYKGRFDGKNYTISGLYFNDTSDDAWDAGIFGFSEGIIQNIGIVDSYIKGRYEIGGICGRNENGSITNCYNTGVVSGSSDYLGGICGNNNRGSITKCYNKGKIIGSDDVCYVGGVCGKSYAATFPNSSITNCYNTGTVSGIKNSEYVGGVVGICSDTKLTNCYNIVDVTGKRYTGGVCGKIYGKASITNCYYDNKVYVGNAVGSKNDETTVSANVLGKTTDMFKTGEVAYLLQGDQTTDVWGQTIGTDKYPVLDGTKRVYVTYTSCNEDIVPDYSNTYSSSSKPVHNYVDGKCSVCGNYEPAEEINGVYQITSPNDLCWFAQHVNRGYITSNAVLTTDIDFDSNFISIGTNTYPFSGTFDGCGHKITVKQSKSSDVALFGYLGNCTVKNLTVTGTIKTAEKFAAGIAMKNSSNTTATIDKCISDVTIQSTVSGDATHGGIIGVARGTVYITSCAFTGAINGSSTHSCGGIIGYIKGYADIRKSYVAASFGIKDTNCNTICRNGKLAYVIGCYYLNNIGSSINGASQKPKEAFANGEVAYLLQGEQREAIWGQRIGIDRYPVLDGTKKVYRYEVRNNGITTYIYSNSGISPVYSANAVSDVGTLKTKSEKQTKTTVTLEWSKESKADGYLIYGNKCSDNADGCLIYGNENNNKEEKNSKKLLKTIKGNKKLTWTHKKLSKATFYSYQIKAYKLVDGKKVIIAQSKDIYATTKGGKYSVASAIKIIKFAGKKVSAKSLKFTFKKGKTIKIKATEIPAEKKKIIKHYRAICYESSNKKIAIVTKNGKIKAVKKGTCKIYVYAQNGVYKAITIKVK